MILKSKIFAMMTARDQTACALREAYVIESRYQVAHTLSAALETQHRALRADIRAALRDSGMTLHAIELLHAEHAERAASAERAEQQRVKRALAALQRAERAEQTAPRSVPRKRYA